MENSSLSSIITKIKKVLNIRNTKNDEIITCTSYLYQFMKNSDNESYNKFKHIFVNLDNHSKNKVINYYVAYKEKQKELLQIGKSKSKK